MRPGDLYFRISDFQYFSVLLRCPRRMESSPHPARSPAELTPSQQAAVAARGNVLVMAGAGTGKTHTLIQRCLACLREEGAALDEILVVTFTEAAAAEMRQRLRRSLEDLSRADPDDLRTQEQLALFDTAHIGTLHSFCLNLVREHFHELGLDPDLTVLETAEAWLRAEETVEEQLERHYAGETEFDRAVQALIQIHGGGRDESIRALILRLHDYAQTRPDAEGWLAGQIQRFAAPEPLVWQTWLLEAIADWREEWLLRLEELRADNSKAVELLDLLRRLPRSFTREQAAGLLAEVQAAAVVWPPRRKTVLEKPLKSLFTDGAFLLSLARVKDGADPLAEDWAWTRGHMTTLLQLARNFSEQFSENKKADGVLDFHDLEQFALKLLWDFPAGEPTPTARHWRAKLRFVFVDEYQDINAAQDQIIQALSRADAEANRFLVGDVKQSIYRFRLADPKIFRDYARRWRGGPGQTLALSENFRSREGLLNWVNSLFEPLMRAEFGGVDYDADARLKFGSPETRGAFAAVETSAPRAELLLLKRGGTDAEEDPEAGKDSVADLDEADKEARLLAQRLAGLRAEGHEIWDDAAKTFRAVEWRDMAVLLRAPSGKAEVYAREFDRAGIPLVVERGGFYESAEVADLLNLLRLLDNPLQDTPAIAVLRSPLAGLSLDELADIRLTLARGHFWTALNRSRESQTALGEETRRKITGFLERFARWRALARQAPLAPCLETVLVETHYLEWLRTRPRGAQRQANVRRLLALAEQFDQFQHQGLHRFLKFTEVQLDAGAEPEVVPVLAENAVRLMSIHQSKGLEFPVVAVADLAKGFNLQDRRAEIIFDETRGLCPRVKPPQTGRRYPSLPHWLAQRELRREQAGEELRLLYVALTRARDTLILTGGLTEKKWETQWTEAGPITPQKILAATSYADWLGLWFARQRVEPVGLTGELPHLRWRLVGETELAGAPASAGDAPPEPPVLDEATEHRLRTVLSWQYGFAAATEYKAKTSVTALRRQAAELADDEAQPLYSPMVRWELLGGSSALSAADTGTAHHTFLQHVRLDYTTDVSRLAEEAERMVREQRLTAEESRVLDLAALAAFWTSADGRDIRGQSAAVRRELAFTTRFRPDELAALSGMESAAGPARELADEFVVVQGVADLAVLLPGEIWLVDFKTDSLAAGELAAKTRHYQPQLKLYAGALAKIYGRPVTRRRLHFLAARLTVEV
jgi:ATP-dependent helicase/nuclease subunit A